MAVWFIYSMDDQWYPTEYNGRDYHAQITINLLK